MQQQGPLASQASQRRRRPCPPGVLSRPVGRVDPRRCYAAAGHLSELGWRLICVSRTLVSSEMRPDFDMRMSDGARALECVRMGYEDVRVAMAVKACAYPCRRCRRHPQSQVCSICWNWPALGLLDCNACYLLEPVGDWFA